MSRYKNFIMLSVATLAAIVMRTVMAFFIIDQQSGFVNGENMTYAVFIVVVILIAAVLVYFQALIGTPLKKEQPQFSGVFRIIISVLLSVAVLWESLKKQGSSFILSWQIILYGAISLVFAVYLIFSSLQKDMSPLWSIIAVVFWLFKLVIAFMEFSTVANTVENIFELMAICTILLFHLTYAKAVCLEPTTKLLKNLNAIAHLSCYMAFITSVPKIIIIFSGYEGILHQNNKTFAVVLLTGMYILSFILKNNKK